MTFLGIVIALYLFCFEHDLFEKPAPTSPDHAFGQNATDQAAGL
jgi:hypothetical protein